MEHQMATASDVAKFFLTMSEPDEGDTVSNLKLQKLCYYAQGFALVILGRPIFGEALEAWDHGPVVPSLYRVYRDYGSGPIPVPTDFDPSMFPREERDVLEDVWNAYGQFSAWKLRNLTHDEPPWNDTPRNEVITHDALRRYFRTRVNA